MKSPTETPQVQEWVTLSQSNRDRQHQSSLLRRWSGSLRRASLRNPAQPHIRPRPAIQGATFKERRIWWP